MPRPGRPGARAVGRPYDTAAAAAAAAAAAQCRRCLAPCAIRLRVGAAGRQPPRGCAHGVACPRLPGGRAVPGPAMQRAIAHACNADIRRSGCLSRHSTLYPVVWIFSRSRTRLRAGPAQQPALAYALAAREFHFATSHLMVRSRRGGALLSRPVAGGAGRGWALFGVGPPTTPPSRMGVPDCARSDRWLQDTVLSALTALH